MLWLLCAGAACNAGQSMVRHGARGSQGNHRPRSPGSAAVAAVAHADARAGNGEAPAGKGCLDVVGDAVRGINIRQGSSIALARRGEQTIAYVADEDGHAIHTLDVAKARWLATTKLDGTPSQLLVTRAGAVAVTVRDRGMLEVLHPFEDMAMPLALACRARVPAEPIGLGISSDEQTLVTASGWSAQLSVLDSHKLTGLFSVRLPAEPRQLLIDATNSYVWVSHAIGNHISKVDLATRAVTAIDATAFEVASTQGYALTSISFGGSARIVAPAVAVDPGRFGRGQVPAGYGMRSVAQLSEPYVAVFDRNGAKLAAPRAPMSTPLRRCMLPRALASHGHELWLACYGQGRVLRLDGRAADPMGALIASYDTPAGPSGLALDVAGSRVLVNAQLDRQLAIVSMTGQAGPSSLPLPGAGTLNAQLARGRRLFHATNDARISGNGRACASCHPDGRSDGLVWATPMGPRQAIMLAGRADHEGGFGWYGVDKSLEQHVQKTVKRLNGTGFNADAAARADFAALLAYVRAMPGPPRASEDAAAVQRGAALFTNPTVGCASCHPGGKSDGLRHNVQSGRSHEASTHYRTPSLSFVSGTAPYFHDGRYGNLTELLRGVDGSMGHTGMLNPDQLADLETYLRSL